MERPILALSFGPFTLPLISRPKQREAEPELAASGMQPSAQLGPGPSGLLEMPAPSSAEEELLQLLVGRDPGLLGSLADAGEPVDAAVLRRWLAARRHSVSEAAAGIQAHAEWRREFLAGAAGVEEASIASELAAQKVFLQGQDRAGQAVVVVQVRGKREGRGRARPAAAAAAACAAVAHPAASPSSAAVHSPRCPASTLPRLPSHAPAPAPRPSLLRLQAGRHDMGARDLEETKRLIVYTLDSACAAADPAQGRMLCLFDLSGARGGGGRREGEAGVTGSPSSPLWAAAPSSLLLAPYPPCALSLWPEPVA